MIRSTLGVVAAVLSLLQPGGFQPDLAIKNVSVSSTLPLADGRRLVAVSFRVQNVGRAFAPESQTRVTIEGASTVFVTPGLQRDPNFGGNDGETAYVSHFLRTAGTGPAEIRIELDAAQTVAEQNEGNNSFLSTIQLDPVEENRWQSIGPSTRPKEGEIFGVGRITALAIHPLNPDVVYAGARGAGLWKTEDGGATWRPVTDALPLARADAVLIDPANPDRVLMASTSGVFESTDGGAVWVRRTAVNLQPTNGGFLLKRNVIFAGAASPSPPGEILYLSTLQGVMVSRDGGRNWTTVLGGRDRNPVFSLQFSTSGTSLLAALSGTGEGSADTGVYIADDDGLSPQSWRKVGACPGPAPAIPANADVWTASSGLQFWISFRAKPAGCGGESCLVKQLWKAKNQACQVNGRTERRWERVDLGSGCRTFAENFSFLFLHPSSPSIVFKGGVHLCRSDAAGSPKELKGSLHVDQHAIAVAPSNPAVMYLGNDGGIYRSEDQGATWRFVADGLAVSEFLDLSLGGAPGQVLLGGTQDEGSLAWPGASPVWKTVDGGVRDVSAIVANRRDATFVYEAGSGIRDLVRLHGTSERRVLNLGLPSGGLYRETPELFGQLVSTGDCAPTLNFDCFPFSAKRPLVAAFKGLWHGPPWRQIDAVAGKEFHRVKLGPEGTWLAGTTGGRVFGGTDVRSLKLLFETPSEIRALAFADARTFLVATKSPGLGRVFRLACLGPGDGLVCRGKDLSPPADFDGEIMAIAVDPLQPEALLAALRENGVIRGAPDGAGAFTWTAYDNGLPAGVTATDMEAAPNGLIFLATWGRGVYVVHSGAVIGSRASARGLLTSFEEKTTPGPFGQPAASAVTVRLDSLPDRVLAGVNLDANSLARLRDAFAKRTPVTIDFVVSGAATGRIMRVR